MGSNIKEERSTSRYQVPAVRRAFEILNLLSQSDRGLRVSDIASSTKIGKGTCYSILKTLEQSDAVLFDSKQKTYRPGAGIVKLADSALGRLANVEAARASMEVLAKKIGFPCFLSAPYGSNDFIIVAKAEVSRSVKVTLDIGQYFPTLGGAQGGAYLAWKPAYQIEETIARLGLPRHTSKSITNIEAFKQRLNRTRRIGYAESYGEYMIGVNSVAAPIFDSKGEVVLILKTLGTSEALDRRRMAQVGPLLRTAAESVTIRIGGRYPRDT